MASDVSSIDKLRDYLDHLESNWSIRDTEIMGEFGDTSINVWVRGRGYAPAVIFSDVDGSLVLDANNSINE